MVANSQLGSLRYLWRPHQKGEWPKFHVSPREKVLDEDFGAVTQMHVSIYQCDGQGGYPKIIIGLFVMN